MLTQWSSALRRGTAKLIISWLEEYMHKTPGKRAEEYQPPLFGYPD